MLKDSDYSYQRVREWIREREFGRANSVFYLAQGVLDEMGEEAGVELIVKQIRKMGIKMGESIRNGLESKGLVNSLENKVKLIESSENSTNARAH